MGSLFNFFYKGLIQYPTPININYFWNFGSLAGLLLGVQLLSGIFLVFVYIPEIGHAFQSVDFLMREVNLGWFVRYLHANGASFFFLVVYIHMFRNLYYGSYMYPREKVWYTGILIFILLILTAFLGYVLPWGQMSYWAATVISSLLSIVPFFGNDLLIFVWGGIAIGQPTLTRIFGLHYLLPFVIVSLVLFHLFFLHEIGSSNPLGCENLDYVPFHPYFTYKDIFGLFLLLIFFFHFVFFYSELLGHTDNYILANASITPTHIVPEWYFLPFYGILRSVPSKVGGVILLLSALLLLIFLPFQNTSIIRSGEFRFGFNICFFSFLAVCILLGWCGGKPIESPFYGLCKLMTFYYFLFFLFFLPLCDWLTHEELKFHGSSSRTVWGC